MKTSKILTLSVLLVGAASLGACNTVSGAGQDIQHAGEKVQEVAN